jgi:hypothetical protein
MSNEKGTCPVCGDACDTNTDRTQYCHACARSRDHYLRIHYLEGELRALTELHEQRVLQLEQESRARVIELERSLSEMLEWLHRWRSREIYWMECLDQIERCLRRIFDRRGYPAA